MKRSLSFTCSEASLVVAGTCLIAGTYGLVRLAYGLFLPDVQRSIGLTDSAAGLISSGASIAYCVGALLGLTAATRARRLVVAALGTAAAGAAAMAVAQDTIVFAPAAVIASTGAGLASPALVALIEQTVHESRQGRAQAVVNTGTGPGLAAAGLLAMLLLPHWRWAWAASAVFTAIAGLAVLHAGGGRDRASTGLDDPARAVGPGALMGHLGAATIPLVGAVGLGAGSAATWTYGRSLLVGAGADQATSLAAWTVIGVGGTVAALTAGTLSRLHPRHAWALTVLTVATATAGLASAPHVAMVAIVSCGLFGWAFVAATSALIAWAVLLAPGDAGSLTAAFFVALVLGQAVGSALVAAVAAGLGIDGGFWAAAAITSLAGVGPLVTRSRDARRSRRASTPTRRAGPRPGSGPAQRSTRC